MEEGLPLVSFLLMCYNQEKYIADAFQSALNQTYSPMEIVVSDDCSSDNSWRIIQEIASSYNGDKKIVLNRNEKNLGMGLNWCKLCSLAKGSLLFKGDGDDLSSPNRVSIIVKDWHDSGRKALLISHSYSHIDLNGKTIGHTILPMAGEDRRSPEDIYNGKGFFHPGTGSAYHRRLYDEFGDFSVRDAPDDAVFVGRAVLLGGGIGENLIRVVPKELVQYRIGSGSTTFIRQYRMGMTKGLRLSLNAQLQMLEDLKHITKNLNQEEKTRFMNLFIARRDHLSKVLMLYEGKTFHERKIGYLETQNKTFFSIYHLINLFLLMPPCLGNIFLNFSLVLKRSL